MKHIFWICVVIEVLLAGCQKPMLEESPHGTSQLGLASIDTLMQSQPDSALTLLLDKPDDTPYYQLLLSEALYKNDYQQANRQELLEAMAYYDSVGDPFLSARCHYMNGVGYYEMDSVVPACEEYMKALDIMEEHFKEKDLVGYKAKFMALTYTRLTELFSDQYLQKQTTYFAQRSVIYYKRLEQANLPLARLFEEMGMGYEMTGQIDSAVFYYDQALDHLPDTNCVIYRNIKIAKAFLAYYQWHNSTFILKLLHDYLEKAESEDEFIARCLSIGEVYYGEQLWDSAWYYLSKVFLESESVGSKKQAAEWMVEICKISGKEPDPYTEYLIPFANQQENQSVLKSRLSELYCIYFQNNSKVSQNQEKKRFIIWLITAGGLLAFISMVLFFYHSGQKRYLVRQMEEERHEHEKNKKTITGQLKESSEALEVERKEKEKLLMEIETQQKQIRWDSIDLFLNENICQEILLLLKGKHVKREAKYQDHPELRLNRTQLSNLEIAVEKHFNGFVGIMTDRYPKISSNEMYQCMLCLLNLKDSQIAALLHSDYSTIKKRSVRIKAAFGTEKALQVYLREWVLEPYK